MQVINVPRFLCFISPYHTVVDYMGIDVCLYFIHGIQNLTKIDSVTSPRKQKVHDDKHGLDVHFPINPMPKGSKQFSLVLYRTNRTPAMIFTRNSSQLYHIGHSRNDSFHVQELIIQATTPLFHTFQQELACDICRKKKEQEEEEEEVQDSCPECKAQKGVGKSSYQVTQGVDRWGEVHKQCMPHGHVYIISSYTCIQYCSINLGPACHPRLTSIKSVGCNHYLF